MYMQNLIFPDLMIFFTLITLLIGLSYIRMQTLLLRLLLITLINLSITNMVYTELASNFLYHFFDNPKIAAFITFITLTILGLFLFRKINFNYSLKRIMLTRMLLAITLAVILLLVLSLTFEKNLIVYDLFSDYKNFILSAKFYLLIYLLSATTFISL